MRARARIAIATFCLPLLLMMSTSASPCFAARNPRRDGRLHAEQRWRREVLLVPRLVLALPRYFFRLLALAVKPIVQWEEREMVVENLFGAFTWKGGRVGLRPAFDFTSDLVPLIGVDFFHDYAFGKSGRFSARFMTSGASMVVQGLARPLPVRSRVQLELVANYLKRNDLLFHGIQSLAPHAELPASRFGIESADMVARVIWRRGSVALEASTLLATRSFIGTQAHNGGDPDIRVAYCKRVLGICAPGGQVDNELVPGFDMGTLFVRPALRVEFDTRRPTFGLSSGVFGAVDGAYSHGLPGDSSSYFRVAGSFGGTIDLWRRSRFLMLRLAVDMMLPVSDVVPFWEMPSLGGPNDLRGFRAWRYRDFSTLLFTAEYRWPVWMWADAALFFDLGSTSGKYFQGISLEELRPDFGIALRVRSSKRFYYRFHIAYGIGGGVQVSFIGGAGP
jgi:hypothetical protein